MPSMPSVNSLPIEHFVTLFDNNFLPMGLCLHESLTNTSQKFKLWVVCMDNQVEAHLRQLNLPNVGLIPLVEVEGEALLKVKQSRTAGEYCWTLTPFTAQFVFERDSNAERVTYLDADLFFYADPALLLDEFSNSGKHVLITEHAYPPKMASSKRALRSGRFCVQFVTFRRTAEAAKVMIWWQARCLEWCFARVEDGKFGDQKYLDNWPTLFGDQVHVLEQRKKTLAPWNVEYFSELEENSLAPVFYHFHGFRYIAPGKVRLYSGYRISPAGMALYDQYLASFTNQCLRLRANDIVVPVLPLRNDLWGRLLSVKRRLLEGEGYVELPTLAGAE